MRSYGTIQDHTGNTGPYKIIRYHIWDHTVPYGTIWDHTIPYGTIHYQLGHRELYGTIRDLTGL